MDELTETPKAIVLPDEQGLRAWAENYAQGESCWPVAPDWFAFKLYRALLQLALDLEGAQKGEGAE